jgi:endonuclease-3
MTKQARIEYLIDYFEKTMPEAETELLYQNPFELLVAVVLSAQCTDKRVNQTTPSLFERFPDADALSKAEVPEVFSLIKSISYPNNKAKHLVGLAQKLMKDHQGEVPLTVEALVQLPGVGRKTANVITSVIDQQPNMAVDTHVFRVSERIGLTWRSKTPLETERQLTRLIPPSLIHKAHHWLILHGRYTCLARSPQCQRCNLTQICRHFKKNRGFSY